MDTGFIAVALPGGNRPDPGSAKLSKSCPEEKESMCKKVMDPAIAHWMERVLIQNGIDREAGMFFAYTVLFMVRDCAKPKECDSALHWLETIGVKLMPIVGLETERLMADARRNYEQAKSKLSQVSQPPRRKPRKSCFAGISTRRRITNPSPRDSEAVNALRERLRYKLKTHTLNPFQHATGR